MGQVGGLGLLYFEPETELSPSSVDSVMGDEGFAMLFSAKLLSIPLAVHEIPPLLQTVRKIHDAAKTPLGRSGCKNCELLDGLMKVAHD